MSGAADRNAAQWWRQEEGRRTEIATPEGVPLDFGVAAAGDRLVAFLADTLIILAALVVMLVIGSVFLEESVIAVLTIGTFLVVNFYFTWFEYRWQGRTPGKRMRSLRVIDADGGRLKVEAVIVRNLTRYAEVFMPLMVLMAPEEIWPDTPGWAIISMSVWMLAFGFMPLLNRQRRRVGDLVAGTLVIRAPQALLLGDLADTPQRPGLPGAVPRAPGADDEPAGRKSRPRWTFTPEHLSSYGIYELQVLEEVLRNPVQYGADEAIRQIRQKIQARIGFEDTVDDDLAFLRAFYTAQRAHLEQGLLMGKRREDKHDGGRPAPGPAAVEDPPAPSVED